MLRFPIDFEVPDLDTEFLLKDNWSVLCQSGCEKWDECLNVYLKYHGIDPTEEVLIFGEISIPEWSEINAKFSNYGSISSKDMHLAKLFRDHTLLANKNGDLVGNINIVKGNQFASFLQSLENEKCVQPKSLFQLSNDIERLLDPETSCYSDVTVTCGSVSIPAHKMILSARSPFFAAMFKHPMKENLENKVNITDLEKTVFQTMMLYIYSGKTSKLTVSSASDLLVAADKYQLQDLKEVCLDFLKSKITLENVVSILVLVDRLDEKLKSFCVDYINKKCKDFSAFEKTEEWKTLKVEHPILAFDVLSSLIKTREKK